MEMIKKYLKPIFLVGILLLSVGCTNSEDAETNAEENGSEENIRTVLQHKFTGPNEEQEKIIKGYDGDIEKSVKALSDYYMEHFKPYMSERFFEDYVVNTNQAMTFLRMAYPDYQMEVEDIDMEEKENYYTFTMNVSYTDNSSEESKTMNVKGHAQTNEDDQLSSIKFSNFEEIRTSLEGKE
ncbi:hypothetical protein LC065_13210 [Halobacillus litoralis]|uniref:hypothetical protein n=1 Tax=Halobacillus litoralis TaxID=45668 RepID=UPI001CFCEFA4|nr:hypothetical protein [Halobacillus litoralis]WLR46526.1 hypothetical protein LC065_13210 [Halobacillus litoralis]